jgi:hypothetical protein
VSSSSYISSVLILLYMLYICPHTETGALSAGSRRAGGDAHTAIYVCPHTTVYVSSYYCVCVFILLCVCPHLQCTCPHTAKCLSSYCYMFVLILLYMCPHTDMYSVEQGLSVMVRDERGATPLHYAAWYGHQDTVEVLLGAGADVNALSGSTTIYYIYVLLYYYHATVLLCMCADRSACRCWR